MIESRGVRNLLSQLFREAIDQRDDIQRTHAKGKKAQIRIDQCTTGCVQQLGNQMEYVVLNLPLAHMPFLLYSRFCRLICGLLASICDARVQHDMVRVYRIAHAEKSGDNHLNLSHRCLFLEVGCERDGVGTT